MKIFYIVVFLSTFVFASEISEAFGDLDGDSVNERVVVWQDKNSHKVLQIFKKDSENKWSKWQEFSNVVMNFDDGGAMGDPFECLEIKNRVITINHSGGGGRFEWDYTHKYRLDLKDKIWKLIGVTVDMLDKNVRDQSLDYNLLTNKAIYKVECLTKEANKCKNIKNFAFDVKNNNQINMKEIKLGENQLIVPKYNEKIYY
ncbi:hypothetical protein [Campylobacter concisus]|uniref:hypothetical protein n=1 Tax=Campylobacter concisus TaxID=199 RepID=UPI000D36224C|nr:hypothetical protein [Campylobacter concisus]